MKKIVWCLAVLLIATSARGINITVKVGNEFAYSDLTVDIFDSPFEVGLVGAFDYVVPSSGLNNMDVDIQDHYLGPVVKFNVLPKDDPVSFKLEYAIVFENVRIDNAPDEMIGATISYEGWGISYMYMLDEYKKDPSPDTDRLMLTWTGKF